MPFYRFEFHEALRTDLIGGIELGNDAAAMAEGVRAAKESLIDGAIDGFDRSKWLVKIYSQDGRAVGHVRFSDLLTSENTGRQSAQKPPRNDA